MGRPPQNVANPRVQRQPDALSQSGQDEAVGKMLRELLDATDGNLMIGKYAGEITCSYKPDGVSVPRMSFSIDDLFSAVRKLLSREPLKTCRGQICLRMGGTAGRDRPISQFARDANARDGRCRRCKLCEAARVHKWYKTKGRRYKRGPAKT